MFCTWRTDGGGGSPFHLPRTSALSSNVRASCKTLLFYSHCTSMSTSFPMLSPIVFVAKHVYVPASCLSTSIICLAKVT